MNENRAKHYKSQIIYELKDIIENATRLVEKLENAEDLSKSEARLDGNIYGLIAPNINELIRLEVKYDLLCEEIQRESHL